MTAPIFTFGIITDTHIRAPHGDLSSPYQVNELANERARYATRLLKEQSPDFVIHLGDMVHPLPGMKAYDDACIEALSIFAPLQPYLYFVAGNHDIGDKPMPGSPAAAVTTEAMAQYDQHFDRSYYSFVHNNCCFIITNSSLINTGLTAEQQQYDWLTETFKDHANQRCFLFSHYPLFLHDPDESEHYDNLAEPGRSRLMALTRKYQTEIVFSGHVHQFFFNVSQNTSFYTLPPTSFTRQDYAELFNAPPADQFGRDDKEKYSVALVDIYADKHRVRLLPTDGRLLKSTMQASKKSQSVATSQKDLIVSLRHAWHKSVDLPYNGPMEEFSRKRVHNDYTLLRLQQMGVSNVRVPLQDLADDISRERLATYASAGICFHIFCTQNQLSSAAPLIKQHSSLVTSLECVLPNDTQHWRLEELSKIYTSAHTQPMIISYACSGAHAVDPDKPFAHTVSTGFEWADHSNVIDRLAEYDYPCDQLMFQIPWEQALNPTLEQIQTIIAAQNIEGVINLRIATSNPADNNDDDTAIAARLDEALHLVKSTPNLRLLLDTFEDIDRGYSPRHGLVDRRYNLRLAGRQLMAT